MINGAPILRRGGGTRHTDRTRRRTASSSCESGVVTLVPTLDPRALRVGVLDVAPGAAIWRQA